MTWFICDLGARVERVSQSVGGGSSELILGLPGEIGRRKLGRPKCREDDAYVEDTCVSENDVSEIEIEIGIR